MGNWKDPEVMALWVWIALIMVLFFAGAIVLLIRTYIKRVRKEEEEKAELALQAQKELLLNSVLVQEKERKRIAADLHDNLVSRLQVIRLSNNTGETTETINQYLQESMKVARRISHDLSPPMLENSALSVLIGDYLEPIKTLYQIHFFANEEKDLIINNAMKLQVLRIFQEVLNNCIKHAKATKIEAQIRANQSSLALLIRDNGLGFSMKSPQGMGMKNIETRCQLLNGSYRFKSKEKEGTQFLLLVPLINTTNYE